MDRPIIKQPFIPYQIRIGAGARVPLSKGFEQADLSMMIDSFIICVPSTAANPIVLGDIGVTATAPINGLEIRPGIPIRLACSNFRQLYEVQNPLLQAAGCPSPEKIPVIAFNLSEWYVTATAQTDISGLLFPMAYV